MINEGFCPNLNFIFCENLQQNKCGNLKTCSAGFVPAHFPWTKDTLLRDVS